MKSYKQLLEDVQSVVAQTIDETANDTAMELMRSGKYDPSVRGNGAKFKRDLIATGKTSSATTASVLWDKHKKLHPSAKVSQPAKKTPDIQAPKKTSGPSVTTRDGHSVSAGDAIGYKRGHERYGTVHKIEGSTIHAKIYNSDTGEHHIIQLHKSEVWKED